MTYSHPCTFCTDSFSTVNGLTNHTDAKHPYCKDCCEHFTTTAEYDDHYKTYHDGPFSIFSIANHTINSDADWEHSSGMSLSDSDYEMHSSCCYDEVEVKDEVMEEVNEEEQGEETGEVSICSWCHRWFRDEYARAQHTIALHKCSLCNLEFRNARWHIFADHLTCQVCARTFRHPEDLEQHRASKHSHAHEASLSGLCPPERGY
ncbi:hypothetical protein DFJ77DRAFT_444929, partial [Powellomyces hirtus]